jgi:hypothetical protein
MGLLGRDPSVAYRGGILPYLVRTVTDPGDDISEYQQLEWAAPGLLYDPVRGMAQTGGMLAGNVPVDPRVMTQTMVDAPLMGGLLASTTGMVPEGAVLGAFAGRGAATADTRALGKAMSMEGRGASRDEIWDETGWYKDVDGEWKFEIPDRDATIKPDLEESYGTQYYPKADNVGGLLAHGDLYGAYSDLGKIDLSQPSTLGGVFRDTGASYLPRHSEIQQVGGEPVVRKIPDRITIYEDRRLDPQTTKSSVLHELQHAIQDREGFAKGGSLETAYAAKVGQVTDRMNELGGLSALKKYNDAWDDYSELNSLDVISSFRNIKQPRHLLGSQSWYKYSGDVRRELGPMPKRSGTAKTQWLQDAGNIIADKLTAQHQERFGARVNKSLRSMKSAFSQYEYAHKFDSDKKALKNAVKRAEYALNKFDATAMRELRKLKDQKTALQDVDLSKLTTADKYEIYRHLAGEAEARNVQTRMDFTPEERAARPPWTTLDVPEDELIVRKKYGGSSLLGANKGPTAALPGLLEDKRSRLRDSMAMKNAALLGGKPAVRKPMPRTSYPIRGLLGNILYEASTPGGYI